MGAWAAQGGDRTRPNIVVIFADDMGYGDLACYGHPTIRTPQLDRMAAEGMKMTSFYTAAPFCTPARGAILTGRYPLRNGQYNNLGPGSTGGLSTDEVTLAEALKPAGYRTACIGKWHLGHMPDLMPTARGFDEFYGLPYSNDMRRPWVQTDIPLQLYRDTDPIEHPVNQELLTQRYTREATRFIRESGDDPFFLYLPHSMPHLPVRTGMRFRGDSRSGLYGDVIQSLDWSTGEVLRTLHAQGVADNTLVLFTSDNGPWLDLPNRMLQEGNERWHSGSPGPLRGWKGNTYEGGMRVPGIAWWPGRIPANQVSADMASTLDVFPTALTLAGVDAPTDRVIDGENLMPFLEGRASSPVDEFFYGRSAWVEGVREGPWKLRLARHARPGLPEGEPVPPELFHLDRDPREQYNVADREPEITERLTRRLAEFAAEVDGRTVLQG
jgi:arylsulfatase A-like enzyme